MSSLIGSSSINQAVGAVTIVEERADIRTESPPQKNNLSNATFTEFENLIHLGTCKKPNAITLYHKDGSGNNTFTHATGTSFNGYNIGNVCYFVATFTNVDGSIQTHSDGNVALTLVNINENPFLDFAVILQFTPSSQFSYQGTTTITVTWTITFTGYSSNAMMYLANGFFQGVGQKLDMMGVTNNGAYPVGSGSTYKFWTLTSEPAFHWSKTLASHGVLEGRVMLDGNPDFFPNDANYTHVWLQLGAYTYDVKALDNTNYSATYVRGRRVDLRISVALQQLP